MKLIIAIIRDMDNDKVSHALTDANYRVTYVASTGGFLRRGQSTLMIGVEDEKVERALEIIRETCTRPSEADNRRSVIFVLKVDDFYQY